MPTFILCPKAVKEVARDVLAKFDTHAPLVKTGVKIDFVFAQANLDADGFPKGDALRLHGSKALAIVRIIPLKQRVLGRGDAEISLDMGWWNDASDEQRAALMDHELHHLTVITNKAGKFEPDDIGRPRLRMRHHDFQFGWFSIIAARHGAASQECVQAKFISDNAGTFLFPKEVMEMISHSKRTK